MEQEELREKIRLIYLASLVSNLPVKHHLDKIMQLIREAKDDSYQKGYDQGFEKGRAK